ncbi:MAG: primosomal protein N' [Actinomycetia bacterium]|nr:primosomal protein N' [Actinomycetes bacterium]
MPRFASVYPLVLTRELDRPFTYLGDGLERGTVVSVPFGRTQRRGVVAEVLDEAPAGIDPAPIGEVLGSVPPGLVDLALWLADYYGSTPARALGLVAPSERRPRASGVRVGSAAVEAAAGLVGEEPPAGLTEEQAAAVARIEAAFGSGASVLLSGVTGSGKTEVYLRACSTAISRGHGAIVLVPEIGLTPQAAARFRARFGDRVAVLHSGLGDAARRDERRRISSGAAPIVVGARSAVFAPVPRLGLICVDEEHDASFKHEADPRYDARTVAAKRAALEGAVAVFGSATPRPESWHALEHVRLGTRVGAPLPRVRLVDLRREAGYPLSSPLLARLGQIADAGGKAVLLVNRRGVAPAIHCRSCGATSRCRSCDVTLVLHTDGRLHCHHCGYEEPLAATCPVCNSAELARLGAGAQHVERELAAALPELPILRLDADAAAQPGRRGEVLAGFAHAERAVLVGTQMVAKGHHFEGVALSAVIDAGTELWAPDFRAEERTFQLVTQLAGRSGREREGEVIVQTFDPDARPVRLAARHAVGEFVRSELARRRELSYPPFARLVRLQVSGPVAGPPLSALSELRAALLDAGGVEAALGPAALIRLRNRHRAHILLKTQDVRRVATAVRRLLAAASPALRRDGLTASVDIDPQTVS